MSQDIKKESNFSVLTVIDNPLEADIIKSLMQSQGIECYLFDENILKQNPLYTTAIGGVKLMVASQNIDKAKKLFEDYNKGEYALKEEDALQDEHQYTEMGLAKKNQAYAPFFKKPGFLAVVFVLLLVLFFSV